MNENLVSVYFHNNLANVHLLRNKPKLALFYLNKVFFLKKNITLLYFLALYNLFTFNIFLNFIIMTIYSIILSYNKIILFSIGDRI